MHNLVPINIRSVLSCIHNIPLIHSTYSGAPHLASSTGWRTFKFFLQMVDTNFLKHFSLSTRHEVSHNQSGMFYEMMDTSNEYDIHCGLMCTSAMDEAAILGETSMSLSFSERGKILHTSYLELMSFLNLMYAMTESIEDSQPTGDEGGAQGNKAPAEECQKEPASHSCSPGEEMHLTTALSSNSDSRPSLSDGDLRLTPKELHVINSLSR